MNKEHPIPPKYATKLLKFLLKETLKEEVLGDLEEKFEQKIATTTLFKAKANYWYQTINYLRPFAIRNNLITDYNPFFMFRHNLKLTFRNFKRDKSTFLINLIGLSTGLACALMIYLWVADEVSVDKFHQRDAQLFQVMKHSESPGGGINSFAWTPAPLAKAMRSEMPEVEYATSIRLRQGDQQGIVQAGDKQLKFTEQYAESDFFKMFSYKILDGDATQFLQRKEDIVISDNFARKVFGQTSNLVGKTIEWEKAPFSGTYQIVGVYQMPPKNATNQFDVVFHFDLIIDNFPETNKWTYGGPDTYIALQEGTDVTDFQEKISTYLQEKSGEEYQSLFIRPYSDKYLYGKYENGQQAGGRIDYVWLFSIIALFILAIACINFMNLSTAKATQRYKEVGVKKAIGAERSHLISQYLSESILITLFSLVVALVLVHLLLPQFNVLTGKELAFIVEPKVIASILGITLFTGLVAGSYPALYLSGFEAVEVLKGKISRSVGEAWIRKGLVVFQFAISVILIVSVLVVYNQIQFIQNKNLGFNKDQVIHFKKEGRLTQDMTTFLNEIKQLPNVVNAAGIRSDLINNRTNTRGLRWEGLIEGNEIAFKYLMVDYNLLETIGVELSAGRTYSKDFGDESNKIIFNESAIKAMGLTDPIGKTVRQWGEDKQIIGVVKDFHFESLYEPVKPCFITVGDKTTDIMVKMAAGTERETIANLSAIHKDFNNGLPLDYQFLDADYATLYASEARVATLSKYFAGIAILISCLGLFGLVTFSAQRRIKEIGIRKVLGASTFGIVRLLSADFTKMVIVAIAIALPISYYIAKNWLDSFAFSIELQPVFFIVAGLSALLIAWLTVGIQTMKAARVNPTVCLKSE